MSGSQEDKYLKETGYTIRKPGRPKKWDWHAMEPGYRIIFDDMAELRRALSSAYMASALVNYKEIVKGDIDHIDDGRTRYRLIVNGAKSSRRPREFKIPKNPKKWRFHLMKPGEFIIVNSILERGRALSSAGKAGVKVYSDRVDVDHGEGGGIVRYRITVGARPASPYVPMDPFSPASGPDDPRRDQPQIADEHVDQRDARSTDEERLRRQLTKSSAVFERKRGPRRRR